MQPSRVTGLGKINRASRTICRRPLKNQRPCAHLAATAPLPVSLAHSHTHTTIRRPRSLRAGLPDNLTVTCHTQHALLFFFFFCFLFFCSQTLTHVLPVERRPSIPRPLPPAVVGLRPQLRLLPQRLLQVHRTVRHLSAAQARLFPQEGALPADALGDPLDARGVALLQFRGVVVPADVHLTGRKERRQKVWF
jgi:hypothetical protein